MGVSGFAGLSTLAVGDHLDRGKERLVMVTSLGLVSVSSIIALGGSLATFAIAFVVLVLGVSNYTVAGHTWISRRVRTAGGPDRSGSSRCRGRSRSWSAPRSSLRSSTSSAGVDPFVTLAVAAAIAAVVVAWKLPNDGARVAAHESAADEHPDGALSDLQRRPPLTTTAWLVVLGSALMALAGMSVFVVSGSWLDDTFGVSTSGIGLIAMGLGGVELLASSTIAAFADRLGKLRSTVAGPDDVWLTGLMVMLVAGDAVAIGVTGLLVFLLGFEYGFVTSLSLTSEAMPDARGAALAIGNRIGTVASAAARS